MSSRSEKAGKAGKQHCQEKAGKAGKIYCFSQGEARKGGFFVQEQIKCLLLILQYYVLALLVKILIS